MYIAPQGTIKLLTGVPLDPSFDHTIFFEGRGEQARWFERKAKYTFTNQQYTRKGKGVIYVEKRTEEVYDCNYLMFKNDGFVLPEYTKWFYAFIVDVEYVNNETTAVYFQIDPMQTWFFDYNLEQCFVEREHTSTDEIGENIMPENLELGDYIYTDIGGTYTEDDMAVVIAAPYRMGMIGTEPVFSYDIPTGFYNNIFSGLYLNTFTKNGDKGNGMTWNDLIQATLRMNEKHKEEIVAIFQMPKHFLMEPTYTPDEDDIDTAAVYKTLPKFYTWTYKRNGSNIQPHNKKLYTYPFNFMYVASSDGEYGEFKYELFKNENCEFVVDGVMGVPPEISLSPIGYANHSANRRRNLNFSLTIRNFPQCTWVTDTFKAWVAQNASKIIVSTGAAVGGAMTGNAVIGAGTALLSDIWGPRIDRIKSDEGKRNATRIYNDYVNINESKIAANNFSAGSAIAQQLAQITSSATMPAQTHGTNRGMISMGLQEFGYHFYAVRPRDEIVAIIDSYFDRFGYATHMTKIPNRNVRPHWTYTKTIGCTITGTLPADATEQICNIYNNGITFWRNGDEVGDYTLDNRPVEEG